MTEQLTELLPLKSLVVNPNHDIRKITSRLLQQLGCNVVELPTYETAFAILKVMNPFDVIFLELDTPVDAGLNFLQQIKSHHPYAIIVATSSLDDSELQNKALGCGAVYCIFERHSRTTYHNVLKAISKIP